MDSKRKVNQVFNKNPQWSQLRGWPKNRWGSCVQILIDSKLKTGKIGQKTADWEKSIKEAEFCIGL